MKAKKVPRFFCARDNLITSGTFYQIIINKPRRCRMGYNAATNSYEKNFQSDGSGGSCDDNGVRIQRVYAGK